MKVMVANAPLSYRETIFAALKAARPHFEVLTTGPACLHRELARLSPQVVVCSRVTGLVNREVHAWVELYPNHAPESFVSLAGQQSVYPDMTFDDLLSVLDEAERLLTSSGPHAEAPPD